LHEKYEAIFAGRMSMDGYVADFQRRNFNKALHSNGRAFDIRPCNDQVAAVLRIALDDQRYNPYGKGIVNEGDHFHVQLSPPVTYVRFADDEALVIEATEP